MLKLSMLTRRSLTGAWIETYPFSHRYNIYPVAPSRGRGLKLALYAYNLMEDRVAPSRGRGLKLCFDWL